MSLNQVLASKPFRKILVLTCIFIYKGRDIINYFGLLSEAIERIETPLQFLQFVSVQICIALVLAKMTELLAKYFIQFHQTWWSANQSDIWRMVAMTTLVTTTHVVYDYDWKILFK